MAGPDEGLLEDVLAPLRAGTSVVLTGVVGSGRSTLLRRAADALEDEGWAVVRVHGVRQLRDQPLEALAAAGVPTGPGAGPSTGPGAPSAASAATAALDRSARGARLLVVLDDAEDVDPVSAGVVAAVRARRGFPLLAAVRPAAPGRRGRLATPPPVARLAMPGLAFDDVAGILDDLLPGGVDPSVAGRIHAKSGGLPGVVVAIVEAARRDGLLVRVRGRWTAGTDLWTPGLVGVVAPYVDALDEDERDVLEKLSLTGAVPVETARRTVAWEAVERLEARGLLRTVAQGTGSVVGVFPPLVAEHYRHLGPTTRTVRLLAELERDLGDAQARTLAPPPPASAAAGGARLLAESVPSARRQDVTVLNRLLQDHVAAQILVRHAAWERRPEPVTAVPYLEVLLASGADDAVVQEVVARTPGTTGDERSRALFVTWQAWSAAFAHDDVATAHRLLRAPAEPGVAGLLHAADLHLTFLADRVPPTEPGPADPAVAPDALLDPPGEPAADGLLRPGPPGTERWSALELARATTLGVAAESLLARGRPDDAAELLRAADAEHGLGPLAARDRDVLHGLSLLLVGDVDDALTWSRRHLDEARTRLDVDALWAHGYVVALGLVTAGRTRELREHLGSVLSVGMLPALQSHLVAGTLAIAAFLALAEGRTAEARLLARQASSAYAGPGPFPGTSATWVLAVLDADDDAGRAAALWAVHEDQLARGYVLSALYTGLLALDAAPTPEGGRRLARAAAGTQGATLERVVRFAEAVGARSADDALAVAHEALRAGHATLGTRALEHAVRLLRRAGDAPRAAEELRAARELVDLDDDLLQAFDRLDPVAELTPRALEIARLASAGLSNQQVADRLTLSVRTVENHLHRVFRKLDADGRSDLTARLGSRAASPARWMP